MGFKIMKKLIQTVLLFALLLNVSATQPIHRIKIFLGTTALAATAAVAYHIWTHYNVTRTLTRLINRRSDELKKDMEDLKTDLSEQKELLKKLQEATGETKQLLLLLLQIQFSRLSPAEKRTLEPFLEKISTELKNQIMHINAQ